MLKWIKSLLGTAPAAGSENEAQTLRLELAERDKLIAQLKADLERLRREAETRGAVSLQAQVESLFTDVAAPVAQLQTQAHLLEVENRPVQARDVLAVAKRLVRVLEDNGLSLENHVGEQVVFDPNRHEPLTTGAAPQPGQPVIVRFVGVALRGKLLRKAGVETTPTPLP
jgi:molecular chaperone GrpE (heat shock protein)